MKKLGREDKVEAGFEEVFAFKESEEVRKFAANERLVIMGYKDLVELMMYGKKCVVIAGSWRDFGNESDYIFKVSKLLMKGMDVRIKDDNETLRRYAEDYTVNDKRFQKDRMCQTRKANKEKGEYSGGRVPYGYYVMGSKLYIDDYESFVVKFIFYRHTQGIGVRGITRELNLRGFRTRSGTEFGPGMITKIISKKRYYQGYDGEIKLKQHPILKDNDELLDKDFINRVFDPDTERRLLKHFPKKIKPYIEV